MSVVCFEKCLSIGYNSFNHIKLDYDPVFIRETEELNTIIAKYLSQAKPTKYLKAANQQRHDDLRQQKPHPRPCRSRKRL